MPKRKTINGLIMEYFQAHPNQDHTHGPVVDWVEAEYLALYHKKPRDTWRAIRKLSQQGRLLKVEEGIYRYNPDSVRDVTLFDFPAYIKEEIFKRDNYKCVVCGNGKAEGFQICADHVKAKDRGGDNSVSNGQTLCSPHNLQKHNYSQTVFGKKLFIKLYEQAQALNDEQMLRFCEAIFDVYDAHGIDTHIKLPQRTWQDPLF